MLQRINLYVNILNDRYLSLELSRLDMAYTSSEVDLVDSAGFSSIDCPRDGGLGPHFS